MKVRVLGVVIVENCDVDVVRIGWTGPGVGFGTNLARHSQESGLEVGPHSCRIPFYGARRPLLSGNIKMTRKP